MSVGMLSAWRSFKSSAMEAKQRTAVDWSSNQTHFSYRKLNKKVIFSPLYCDADSPFRQGTEAVVLLRLGVNDAPGSGQKTVTNSAADTAITGPLSKMNWPSIGPNSAR